MTQDRYRQSRYCPPQEHIYHGRNDNGRPYRPEEDPRSLRYRPRDTERHSRGYASQRDSPRQSPQSRYSRWEQTSSTKKMNKSSQSNGHQEPRGLKNDRCHQNSVTSLDDKHRSCRDQRRVTDPEFYEIPDGKIVRMDTGYYNGGKNEIHDGWATAVQSTRATPGVFQRREMLPSKANESFDLKTPDKDASNPNYEDAVQEPEIFSVASTPMNDKNQNESISARTGHEENNLQEENRQEDSDESHGWIALIKSERGEDASSLINSGLLSEPEGNGQEMGNLSSQYTKKRERDDESYGGDGKRAKGHEDQRTFYCKYREWDGWTGMGSQKIEYR